MNVEQFQYHDKTGWVRPLYIQPNVDWVLVFGAKKLVETHAIMSVLDETFPNAIILVSSTSGEIHGNQTYDDSLSVSAVTFKKTSIKSIQLGLNDFSSNFMAGQTMANALKHDDLCHLFVISDGVVTNATELLAGIYSVIPKTIAVTGGLSGDGADFNESVLGLNGHYKPHQTCMIGFYGQSLKIGYGSRGGWRPFGPKRSITRADNNILYELDKQAALDLYKLYTQDQELNLPASGLLFPLSIYNQNSKQKSLVRTVVGINETEHALIFAGDVPEGTVAQMMHATTDDLIGGAIEAAESSMAMNPDPEFIILVSCVGRKLIMGQQADEEIEEIAEIFSKSKNSIAGFYSYGELCPFDHQSNSVSLLHNQTMTITAMREIE